MNQLTAEQLAAMAKDAFENNPTVNTFYFTNDGMFFTSRGYCAEHCKTCGSELGTVSRSDLDEELEDSTGEEEHFYKFLLEEGWKALKDGDLDQAYKLYLEADIIVFVDEDDEAGALAEAIEIAKANKEEKEQQAQKESMRIAAEALEKQAKEAAEAEKAKAEAEAKEKAYADAVNSFNVEESLKLSEGLSNTAESAPIVEPVAAPVTPNVPQETTKKVTARVRK